MKGSRHLVAVAGALALAASLTAGLATGSAADTDEEGTLGGPLHAEMYPSGLDTAPDGTVVVADTGNNRVAEVQRQRGADLGDRYARHRHQPVRQPA